MQLKLEKFHVNRKTKNFPQRNKQANNELSVDKFPE